MISNKQCLCCMEIKAVSEFHIANNNEDGYRNDCKQCRKEKKKRAQIQPEKLKCKTCGEVKPNTPEFFKSQSRDFPTKLKKRQCKACAKKYLADRAYRFAYKIGYDDVKDMIRKQNNKCAICQQEVKKLCVDHCHKTGEVRGMLCDPCNHGVGNFKDSIELLQKAQQYLRSYNHGESNGST